MSTATVAPPQMVLPPAAQRVDLNDFDPVVVFENTGHPIRAHVVYAETLRKLDRPHESAFSIEDACR